FLLVSLGAGTPFYRVWWAVMPLVKKTRAPGMAFFVVALMVALLAGMGAERLERKEGRPHLTAWLVAAGIVALLAVTGVFGAMALGVYPPRYYGVPLMAFDIPQMLGHHGNELRYYDELLGAENGFENLRFVQLWGLLSVRYVIAPSGARNADSIPGYKRILDSVPTSAGVRANLFERIDPAPYARVVPGAFKATDSAVVVPTLVDPRIDYSRVVLV